MGAIAVQAKYEKTTDPKRMMVHSLLNEAIRTDFENIRGFLPARTATNIRYEKGAKTAMGWNEGGSETKIDLPLNDGWYVPDGNPFAIPNGKKSNSKDPEALYLVRHQDRRFSGPLGRGSGWDVDGRVRGVGADDFWSYASGVALVSGRGAAAPKIALSKTSESSVLVTISLEELRAIVGDANASLSDLAQTVRPEKLAALARLVQSLEIKG